MFKKALRNTLAIILVIAFMMQPMAVYATHEPNDQNEPIGSTDPIGGAGDLGGAQTPPEETTITPGGPTTSPAGPFTSPGNDALATGKASDPAEPAGEPEPKSEPGTSTQAPAATSDAVGTSSIVSLSAGSPVPANNVAELVAFLVADVAYDITLAAGFPTINQTLVVNNVNRIIGDLNISGIASGHCISITSADASLTVDGNITIDGAAGAAGNNRGIELVNATASLTAKDIKVSNTANRGVNVVGTLIAESIEINNTRSEPALDTWGPGGVGRGIVNVTGAITIDGVNERAIRLQNDSEIEAGSISVSNVNHATNGFGIHVNNNANAILTVFGNVTIANVSLHGINNNQGATMTIGSATSNHSISNAGDTAIIRAVNNTNPMNINGNIAISNVPATGRAISATNGSLSITGAVNLSNINMTAADAANARGIIEASGGGNITLGAVNISQNTPSNINVLRIPSGAGNTNARITVNGGTMAAQFTSATMHALAGIITVNSGTTIGSATASPGSGNNAVQAASGGAVHLNGVSFRNFVDNTISVAADGTIIADGISMTGGRRAIWMNANNGNFELRGTNTFTDMVALATGQAVIDLRNASSTLTLAENSVLNINFTDASPTLASRWGINIESAGPRIDAHSTSSINISYSAGAVTGVPIAFRNPQNLANSAPTPGEHVPGTHSRLGNLTITYNTAQRAAGLLIDATSILNTGDISISNTTNTGLDVEGVVNAGNIVVKNTASGQGVRLGGASARLNATSIDVETAFGNGVFINNAAGRLNLTGDLKIDGTGEHGLSNNAGSLVTVGGNVLIENVGAAAHHAIHIGGTYESTDTSVAITGNIIINNVRGATGRGISLGSATSKLTAQDITITGTGAEGLDTSGQVTARDISITDAGALTAGSGQGIRLRGGAAVLSARNVTIEETAANGIFVDNAGGSMTLTGGNLKIEDTDEHGLSNASGGTVTVNAAAGVGGNVRIENVGVTGAHHGVHIGNTGSVTIQGDLEVDDVKGTGRGVSIADAATTSTLTARDITITNIAGGEALTTGRQVTARDIKIEDTFGTSGQGVRMAGANARLNARNLIIENVAANGIFINNVGILTLDEDLTIDTAAGHGITLNPADGVTETGTITVGGDVTITDVTRRGISNLSDGTITIAGILEINNTGEAGVYLLESSLKAEEIHVDGYKSESGIQVFQGGNSLEAKLVSIVNKDPLNYTQHAFRFNVSPANPDPNTPDTSTSEVKIEQLVIDGAVYRGISLEAQPDGLDIEEIFAVNTGILAQSSGVAALLAAGTLPTSMHRHLPKTVRPPGATCVGFHDPDDCRDFLPPYQDGRSFDTTGMNEATIMSYNICYWEPSDGDPVPEPAAPGSRRPNIMNFILDNDIDVVGLQEVSPMWVNSIKNFATANDYAFFGIGRQGTNFTSATPSLSWTEQFALILWNTDKFELVTSGNFWLSATPNTLSSNWPPWFNSDADYEGEVSPLRCVNWVRLKDIASGDEIVFLNVHTIGHSQNHWARALASRLIVDRMKSFFDSNVPVVLLGDYNMQQHDTAYTDIIDAGYEDVRWSAQTSGDRAYGSYNSFDRFNESEYSFADYMFVSPNIVATTFEIKDNIVGGVHQSDHSALIAKIHYGTAPGGAPRITVGSTGLDALTYGTAVAADAAITYTLTNDTYVSGITPADFAPLSGQPTLPAGLTAGTAVRTSDTVVTVPITGTPEAANASESPVTLPGSIPAANLTTSSAAIATTGNVTASAVARATLTVTPSTGQSKAFGTADPTLAYGHVGAVGSETPVFTGALARAGGEAIGNYAINQGTLALANNGTFIASNYTLAFSTTTVNFAITEFTTPAEASLTPNGANGWFNDAPVTLSAPAGFQISTSTTGPWAGTMNLNQADGDPKTADYYLRETATGATTTTAKTVEYKVDTTPPTAQVQFRTNAFRSFMNTITFGLFFKNTVAVNVQGSDALSGVANVAHVLSATGWNVADTADQASIDAAITAAGAGAVTPGATASFNIAPDTKMILYVRVTDEAGNRSYFSDGLVVYTDSAETASATFTRSSTAALTVPVTMNGNTVSLITRGGATVDPSNYDITTADRITFTNTFMKTLEASATPYEFVVSYNPLGVTDPPASGAELPGTTTISITVSRGDQATLTVNPVTPNPTYTVPNGTVTLATTGGSSTGAVTYTVVSGPGSVEGSTLTITGAGDIIVTATKAADDDYNAATSAAQTITVNKAARAPIAVGRSVLFTDTADKTYALAGYVANYKLETDTLGYTVGAVTGTADVTIGIDAATGVLSYKLNNTGTIGQTAAAPVTVTGFANYDDITINVTVTLTDKLVVNITGVSVTGRAYNGSAIVPTGTPVVTLEEDGTAVTDFLPLIYTYTNTDTTAILAGAPIDVGNYQLVVSIANADPKYTGESTPIAFSITKGNQSAPAAPTEVTASRTATSIVVSTSATMQYAISSTNSAASVTWVNGTGSAMTFDSLTPNTTYYIFARLAETPNLNASPASVALAVTTNRAALGGTVSITGTMVFGSVLTSVTSGLTSTPDISGGAGLGALAYQWQRSADGGTTWTNIAGATSATYTLAVADVGAGIRVAVTAANTLGTVNGTNPGPVARKAPVASDFSFVPPSVTYDGTPKSVTVTGQTGMGAITVLYEGIAPTVYASSNTAPTDAGTYSISVTVAQGAAYEAVTGLLLSGTFTVNKATITITADSIVAIRGTAMPSFTYTVSGLAASDDLTTEPTLTSPTANMGTAGNYPIVATGAEVPDEDNYNDVIVYVNGTLTVANAAPGNQGEVAIPYEQSGGTVTVLATQSVMDELIDTAVNNVAIIDLSAIQGGVTAADIPASLFEELAAEGLSVQIALPQGTITLDPVAAASLAEQAGDVVTLTIFQHQGTAALSTAQQNAVNTGDAVFSIVKESNGTPITTFNGGTLTITVAWTGTFPATVWYLAPDGSMRVQPTTPNAVAGTVTFTTTHLSEYLVRANANQNQGGGSGRPQTGDESNSVLWWAVLIASALGMAVVSIVWIKQSKPRKAVGRD